jgi:hypothetical protein
VCITQSQRCFHCYFGVAAVILVLLLWWASTTTKQLPMRHADAVAFRNVHNKHAIAIAIAIDMDIDIDIVIDIVVV